jgi:SAM-dependent methyltransferase
MTSCPCPTCTLNCPRQVSHLTLARGELGPGSSYGAQLILASMGARVILADRFLARWDDDYHPTLYAAIAKRWSPKDQIDAVIRARSHAASSLRLLEEQAENLRSIPSETIDFVYSNAVLEHIVDVARVADETARILKPGGWAMHQIDLRDHRDFSRPLEHLIMRDHDFFRAAKATHYEFGNRFRAGEFNRHFVAAGLRIVELEVTDVIRADYLAEALPRLRESCSPYRSWPEDDLHCLGAAYLLQNTNAKGR